MGVLLGFLLSMTVSVSANDDQGKRIIDSKNLQLAHSSRNDRILVDANINNFDKSYATRTSPLGLWLPDLQVLSYREGVWKKTSLPDWDRIKGMIIAKATAKSKQPIGADERTIDNAKAFLTGREATSVYLSDNGQYAFINLQFRSIYYLPYTEYTGSQSPRFQNWFGLWDLEKNKLIKEWTSADLDGGGSRELQVEDVRDESFASQFERQLVARMLSDGTVIVARNLEQHLSRDEGYVSTRVMIVKNDGQSEVLNDVTPTYVKKDPGWSGTRQLSIVQYSQDGSVQIVSDIADLGKRFFEVIPARSDSPPSL